MFKKNVKIVKSIIMLSLVLSMIFGMFSVAYAADTVINSVTVKSLPTFVLGGEIADAKVVLELPQGCKAETQWSVWDKELEEYKPVTSGKFNATDIYNLSVLVTGETGYSFTEDFTVNCPEDVECGYSANRDDELNPVSYTLEFYTYTFAKSIQKVEITTPEVKVGNTASVNSIVFYSNDEVIANENITIDCKWLDEADNSDVTGSAFKSEKSYALNGLLTAKAGYCFDVGAEVYVNGELITSSTHPAYIDFNPYYSLFTPIDHVDISNLPEVKEGAALSTAVTVNSHTEHYDVTVHWHDEDEVDITDEKFVAGKTYILCIDYCITNRAALADDFVFKVDGKDYNPLELEAKYGNATLEFKYVVEKGKVSVPVVPSGSPDTGDSSSMMFYVMMLMLSFAVVVSLYGKYRINKIQD